MPPLRGGWRGYHLLNKFASFQQTVAPFLTRKLIVHYHLIRHIIGTIDDKWYRCIGVSANGAGRGVIGQQRSGNRDMPRQQFFQNGLNHTAVKVCYRFYF